MKVSRKIVLRFPPIVAEQPIVYRLVRDYNLEINILRASINPNEDGLLVLEVAGERTDYDQGIRFLGQTGVEVQPLSKDVSRREERCTHCGACITLCPSRAFVVEPTTRRIDFVKESCIACEVCIRGCPVRAMELRV